MNDKIKMSSYFSLFTFGRSGKNLHSALRMCVCVCVCVCVLPYVSFKCFLKNISALFFYILIPSSLLRKVVSIFTDLRRARGH